MLMNLAANVFYSSGVSSLTSQDALSLLDQGFRSSVFSVALVFMMFVSNQLVAVSWSLGRQTTIHDFFRLEIPSWLHRATIRIIAIIPALFCVWNSGAEGIFQLLIFTQVLVALLLPSSVIPLFRVATSRSVMGAYKVSHLVAFFSLISFVGMLGLKIVFVIELVFGTSDWVIGLRWNSWSSVPISYLILLIAAFASMCLMLWLAIIPLKSVCSGVDTQALCWDKKVTESSTERGPIEISEHQLGKSMEKQEPVSSSSENNPGNYQKSSTPTSDLNLPETLLDSEINLDLTPIEENISEITFPKPAIGNLEALATISESAYNGSGMSDKSELLDNITFSTELKDVEEKTVKIEGDVQNEKDDEGESWKPEESIKDVSENNNSFSSDGPGSFRSLSGKNDDVGSGAGSLSRLAGLGRAARRQLTAILDEFWGQLFDFHGLATHEAKARKLDVVLGIESKVDSKSSFAPVKLESVSKDSSGYIPSPGGAGPDLLRTPSFYHSSVQHIGQSNIGSPLGIQQGSSVWTNHMQLLDAYVRTSSHNTFDADERRYRSMHVPSSSDGHDQQPATIHGYDLASYLGRMAKEKGSGYQKSQLESITQASTPSVKPNSIDSYGRPLGPKPQNGLLRPPGFHNVPVSRNNSLKSERPNLDVCSPELVDYGSNPPNVKKFHSLPDISGLYIPLRDTLSDKSSHWDSSVGYGQSINRPVREQMRSSGSTWVGAALGFNDFSPPKVSRDAYSSQFSSRAGADSLWSRQPYEQFGVVADKSPSKIPETASSVDIEAKLLQSFRSCINRLLKLEGSDWLFRQNDGADEDLIDRVAARERFIYEAETRTADRKFSTAMKIDETEHSKFMSIPNCGDGCVWHVDLILSFGVWCIHRILELSLMESRPELWGKYTYVLNRLQGIIDLAFSKPRSPMVPCFCLQLPAGYQQKSSPPPISNGSLPPPSKLGRGKFTTAAMLLDIVKDVEIAISCRKGRTGTAAGDVAFPKGKENLASVLKRYKRRLSNKPVGEKTAKVALSSSPQGL
ncbi:hypothetical protein ACS0TY_026754 [Phlomoides rotata]